MGHAYGALGQSRRWRSNSPSPPQAKKFFWPQMKTIPYCGLLQKSKLTTIWNCFQRNPNWPQYGIVFKNNSILWITYEIIDFEDFEKFRFWVKFWVFWSFSECINNIKNRSDQFLRDVDCDTFLKFRLKTRHAAPSTDGRTHGRTNATPSENRCSHCFILRVKKFLESNDASYAPFPTKKSIRIWIST